MSVPSQVSKTPKSKPTKISTTKNDTTKIKSYKIKTEQEILDTLFNEDEAEDMKVEAKQKTVILKIKQRNQKAVKALKSLYDNRCQISGALLTFKKKDGTYYSEVHHLVPLGEGGADNPQNIIIVSPLIHRMLHFAKVEGIDLSNITSNSKGEGTLKITINDEENVITWHAQHAKRVLDSK